MRDKIFNVLYDKISENHNFDFSKEIGNRILMMPLGKFDVLKIADLNNSDFVKAAYLGILNRSIDESAYSNWSKYFSMNSKEFKVLLLKRMIDSEEFKIRNIEIINNIFIDDNIDSVLGNVNRTKLPFNILVKSKIRKILKYIAKFMKPLLDNDIGRIIKEKVKKQLE